MEITWLGILAIAILIFTGYGGYRKGFVREIMSFFFVFLIISSLRLYVAPKHPGSSRMSRREGNINV